MKQIISEYRPNTIYVSINQKDEFIREINDKIVSLDKIGDECAINSVNFNLWGNNQKLTIKLVDKIPKRSFSKDAIFAFVISIGCLALIAVALFAPKKINSDKPSANTQLEPRK
jgi:hypothetical protein